MQLSKKYWLKNFTPYKTIARYIAYDLTVKMFKNFYV